MTIQGCARPFVGLRYPPNFGSYPSSANGGPRRRGEVSSLTRLAIDYIQLTPMSSNTTRHDERCGICTQRSTPVARCRGRTTGQVVV